MSVILASNVAAANTSQVIVRAGESVVVFVTNGIASGEDCNIELKSETDTWSLSGEALTVDIPSAKVNGPIVFRVAKPSSALAFGVELISNTKNDMS